MQLGIFTQIFGGGICGPADELFPLPLREEGLAGIGRGRAAGHRVQLADWAYLFECVEERAQWVTLTSQATVRHEVYPHRHVFRIFGTGGGQTYVQESNPSQGAFSNVLNIGGGRVLFAPDAEPQTANGWWRFGDLGDDRSLFLYKHFLPAGIYLAAHRPRRVDDVRAAYYDVMRATRIAVTGGTAAYYYEGAIMGAQSYPSVSLVGQAGGAPGAATRNEIDEFRQTAADGEGLWRMHPEVLAHADFAATPAWAVVQLRVTRSRNSVPLQNWGRYVVTRWSLAGTTASVDLSACGCDTDGVAAYLSAVTGGNYVEGDLYRATAEVMDVAADVAFPGDKGLFTGWTWTPDES